MASIMQVRLDDDLKTSPYEVLTEHEILCKLEKSHEHAAQGMYKDAIEVSRNMREKYEL
ncbi:MAG: hypothetical protein K2O32_15040 [Acetatifactor sp.]|nr:hypothetical protein [Acetatifactor sp.]